MSDTFEVLNPATEDIVKKVHMASPAEVDDVVAKAKKAWPAWHSDQAESHAARKLPSNAAGN